MSEFFQSLGIDPFLGGLICGIIICAIARVGIARAKPRGGSFPRPLDIRLGQSAHVAGNFTSLTKISVSNNGQPVELSAEASTAIMDALRRGDKIEAIKILREASSLDLKGAKDMIDVLAQSMPR